MAVIRQSDLASFSYCAARQHFDVMARAEGHEPRRLSATILGSVVHYAFMIGQQLIHEGREDAIDVALATFEHYWSPDRAHEVCEGWPNEWARGHTADRLLVDGRSSLRKALGWAKKEKTVLLGIEVPFNVPIEVDGEQHTLHGTIDRLVLRNYAGRRWVQIEDAKTGKKPAHLRLALQWTAYSYATLQPEFWAPYYEEDTEGFNWAIARLAEAGEALHEGIPGLAALPRRGRWLWLRNGDFSTHDCGERTQWDYNRLRFHVREYLRAQAAGVHPPTTDTEKCQYCPWRDGVCGQEPFPDHQPIFEQLYIPERKR